jgi:hypothetical protein
VPTEALSHCSQPWSGLQHYGYGPYTQSTLFDGMIHPFGTGPTSFSFGPGRPGAVKRPSRFPTKIHFVRGFCMGAQGACTPKTVLSGPGSGVGPGGVGLLPPDHARLLRLPDARARLVLAHPPGGPGAPRRGRVCHSAQISTARAQRHIRSQLLLSTFR